jgi:nitrogen fixation protein FixH
MSDATRAGADFDPRRSRWIPWVFVGGMLLVVVVNAVLVFASVSTFTGVTTGHAYDRGRAYNHVLEEAARQNALGWTAHVKLEGGMLAVSVIDRDGLPVGGRVEGVLQRPLEGAELALDFAAAGPGRFIAFAPAPGKGQWEARLALHGAGGERLDIRERVIVP